MQVQLIDDISGEEAQETVTFALDDAGYEIDLTESHAAELREALQTFVSNGRRLKGRSAGRRPPAAAGSRVETQRIREWAEAKA